MGFHKGSKVWVASTDGAWMAAEVVSVTEKLVIVITDAGKQISILPGKLCPRDPDEEHGGVDDMTKLTHLNEPGVLHNLARRYAHNEIYTYTGSILIAVNPFTKLPHLYSSHMMMQYRGVQFGELSPHVFAVADASYRALISEKQNQSVLVSGESGAGKTETTKLIMQYLTFVGGRASVDDRMVEQQVLESNPLLEAFGNAKTVRNDNSSRFGKFVEIQFDESGRISGAAIRTYLLERSRVVQIADSERNYHCFYQLCASGKDAEKFKLDHPSKFHYLNQSQTYALDGMSDAQEYIMTRKAMEIVGIDHDDQEAIFRVLAAILHLGNVDFSPGMDNDSSAIENEKSMFHLKVAANLLKCDENLLCATLCTRSIQTVEGTIVKALDCAAAVANRDALAKTIYARLFDWLVEKINISIGQDTKSKLQIGVLDIYGFECFGINSFEQFCINFANEKLQQHFNEHVFKMEQEEYQHEGIDWSYIEFVDNQDVLDLIEKRPIGIIGLLDEACMFPRSTPVTFSMKLFQSLGRHPRLMKSKFLANDFTICHYAGEVTYQINLFLEKNRDYVVVEHCNMLSSSRCPFVMALFRSPEESPRSNYKFSSVVSRFKQQLQALMETLNSTQPHYIRCVKPNSFNCPHLFEDRSVLQQLRCGGVLEAVRISLAGYPTRRLYSEFVDRYGILAPEVLGSYDDRVLTKQILQKLKLENFQLGHTKIFLRAGQIAALDSKRAQRLDNAARWIQSSFRMFTARKHLLSMRVAAVIFQACCRGFVARTKYAFYRQEAAALSIQKCTRRLLHRHAYLQLQSVAIFIQSSIRKLLVQHILLSKKKEKSALLIQVKWRMWRSHVMRHQYVKYIVALQCAWRMRLAKKQLQHLKLESRKAGALLAAKSKLEKELEELSWRLCLEKKMRASSEESRQAEFLKHQREMRALTVEMEVVKSEMREEIDRNMLLQRQLDSLLKEKEAFSSRLAEMVEVRADNIYLMNSLEAFKKENLRMEGEVLKARTERNDAVRKLHGIELQYFKLQQDLHSLEEKLSTLEHENHVLRQRVISLSPKFSGISKPFTEKFDGVLALSSTERKQLVFESPTPSKCLTPFTQTLSNPHHLKINAERNQNYLEVLLRCIKANIGFVDGKPVAACILYKCLLHWKVFEAERTTVFDFVIAGISDALKAGDESKVLPYWLSNTSALLCLLQRNLRPNGLPTVPTRCSIVFSERSINATSSPVKLITCVDGASVDARYPAVLFKQQLTACLEKIFGMIRDNLKKEISPLLSICIQAPKSVRTPAGRLPRPPGDVSQQSLSNQWKNIIKFLNSFLACMQSNHVPSFFTRKLTTQLFSFINIQLFNSLLLRRECCTFSNGEYVKSGLAELEQWIATTSKELSGTSWYELKYIRQAVGFLVIHQKRKKTFDEICNELCPALTVRQIYRICTMYWDDKYSTHSVSSEVLGRLRDTLSKESQDFMSNSFLLDDDLSIPFSADDLSKAIPPLDPSNVEPPPPLHELLADGFLFKNSK